jgi:hypothetical protein
LSRVGVSANASRPLRVPADRENRRIGRARSGKRTNGGACVARRRSIKSSIKWRSQEKVHRNLFNKFRNFTVRESVFSTRCFPARPGERNIFKQFQFLRGASHSKFLGKDVMAKNLAPPLFETFAADASDDKRCNNCAWEFAQAKRDFGCFWPAHGGGQRGWADVKDGSFHWSANW